MACDNVRSLSFPPSAGLAEKEQHMKQAKLFALSAAASTAAPGPADNATLRFLRS
jgi:hypothetical protein